MVLLILAVSLTLTLENKIISVEGFSDFLALVCLAIYSIWLISSLVKFRVKIKNIKSFYNNIITPLLMIIASVAYFLWIDALI